MLIGLYQLSAILYPVLKMKAGLSRRESAFPIQTGAELLLSRSSFIWAACYRLDKWILQGLFSPTMQAKLGTNSVIFP